MVYQLRRPAEELANARGSECRSENNRGSGRCTSRGRVKTIETKEEVAVHKSERVELGDAVGDTHRTS